MNQCSSFINIHLMAKYKIDSNSIKAAPITVCLRNLVLKTSILESDHIIDQ